MLLVINYSYSFKYRIDKMDEMIQLKFKLIPGAEIIIFVDGVVFSGSGN